MSELRLELLLGRTVRDAEGRKLGPIEEVRAEQMAGELVVQSFDVGPGGRIERLFAAARAIPLLRFLPERERVVYCIPWQEMDFTDPRHPRTRLTRATLERSCRPDRPSSRTSPA